MRRALFCILLLVSPLLFAQETHKTSVFHRLLIFNESGELLIVRFEETDRWVTPGWYQDGEMTIKEGLTDLAAQHGVQIGAPVLRGIFTLEDTSGGIASVRLVHSIQVQGGRPRRPEGIGEVRWAPVPEALELITFPHITAQIEQVTRHPDAVWGGSQTRYQEDGNYGSEVVEDFYRLYGRTESP